MKICILGASGRVGKVIAENALQNGHSVHALVRKPAKTTLHHPYIRYFEGNALNKKDLVRAMEGTEAVVSALNTDGTDTLSTSIPLIIETMGLLGIKRVITIGTAGILQARTSPGIYRFQSSESLRKSTRAAEDHLKAYLLLEKSDLKWTIVCPTYLPDGERKSIFRTEKDFLPEGGTSISIFDTGDCAYRQLFSDEFLHSRVGICY